MRSSLATIAAGVFVTPALVLVTTPAHAASARCSGVTATIVGTPGPDLIPGTEGDDVIVGQRGRDTIDGRGGNDLICGNRGEDWIDGGLGDDTVRGSLGVDDLGGGLGNDTLYGGSGRAGTKFRADAGDDDYRAAPDRSAPQRNSTFIVLHFESAPGPLSVDIGTGTASGWGNDTFRFSFVPQDLPGRIILNGSDFPDTLIGSDLTQDSIYGGAGDDFLLTGGESDDLNGGPGDDRLSSGAGTDYLYGDIGDDTAEWIEATDSCTSIEHILVGASSRCPVPLP